MKKWYIIIALFPVSFLFNLFEYNLNLKNLFLKIFFLGCIIISALVLKNIKIRFIILLSIAMNIISIILGSYFIINDVTWFKPFGRNFCIAFVGIIYFLGQLVCIHIFKYISSVKLK